MIYKLNINFQNLKRKRFVLSGEIFRKSKCVLFIFLSFMFTANLNGQTERKYIRQGNKNYNQQQYNESELLYRKAIDISKSSADAVFNLGDALYKQQKFEEAANKFNENYTSASGSKEKANSMYNLGNSMLKSQKVEESIEAYKNSLKLDPSNISAKYNLAYAQDLLKKQQQQQQQQNQDQKKDQQENNQDQNNKDKQDEKEKQQPQQQSISKEDAERLLSALANDENKVQEKVKKDKAEKGMIRTLKNW
jgi:Ca-activated chloride channel family protein